MGSISLFTSCVDADYYDLYEDEEEILSPRSKKGKDIPGNLSDYPLMDSGWQEAECVACCYSNIYNITDKAACRVRVIEAEYGPFCDKYYKKYFEAVQSRGVSLSTADAVLGSNKLDAESFAAGCVGMSGVFNYPKLAVYGNSFSHVAMVTGMYFGSTNSGYVMYINVIDQFGPSSARYYIVLDSNKHLVSKDFECFLLCR